MCKKTSDLVEDGFPYDCDDTDYDDDNTDDDKDDFDLNLQCRRRAAEQLTFQSGTIYAQQYQGGRYEHHHHHHHNQQQNHHHQCHQNFSGSNPKRYLAVEL